MLNIDVSKTYKYTTYVHDKSISLDYTTAQFNSTQSIIKHWQTNEQE